MEKTTLALPLNVQALRLPRGVELDPRGPRVLRNLTLSTRPLWQGGKARIPLLQVSAELVAALQGARSAGRVVRGLEDAGRRLAAEERGLRMADRRSDAARGPRVSRLLVLSNDGGERFYRHVETLLRRYAARVLALCLDMDAVALGELVFGPGHPTRLILIEHKEAVCSVLLALAGQEEDPSGREG